MIKDNEHIPESQSIDAEALKSIMENLTQELRRGTLVLSVLTQMNRSQYGYSLIQSLSENGIDIEQNTLYPLLRRLEKLGLLDSQWQVEESRPRRYYILSVAGKEVLNALVSEWRKMNQAMESLLSDDQTF